MELYGVGISDAVWREDFKIHARCGSKTDLRRNQRKDAARMSFSPKRIAFGLRSGYLC